MNETLIQQIFGDVNLSGGIPLNIIQTTQTNWWQFGITAVIAGIGSILVLFLIGSLIKDIVLDRVAKLQLYLLKRESKRHQLIIKHTTSDFFNQAMISEETLKTIQKAFLKFKGKDFDLILHTPGGIIFSTLLISRLIKNYPGKVRVFIPSYSMSGGTILALSGDEIFMSQNSCLGPVDPQLGNLFKFGSSKSWNYIMKFKGKKADDSSISMALTGRQYTKTLSNYLFELLKDKVEPGKIKPLTKFLTSGNVEHAYQLTPETLIDFGLKIKFLEPKIEKKMIHIISSGACEGVHYV